MKDLLDKIGSYNIFNYLFPGCIFAIAASKTTEFNLIQPDIISGAFVYYFLGSAVSRIGSLIIEPLLKKIGFISFAEYEDFIKASKNDALIEKLSESNNMYRTICSVLFCLALLNGVELAASECPAIKHWLPHAAIFSLFSLYLYSYKKQTDFINKRVQSSNNG